jgi:hypothetical protein
MSGSWNFERRRVVCGAFVVGVSLLTKGQANVATSLEAVRSRMRLPPEDALFAARRLSEEQLIGFDEGGAVRSNAKGIRHADDLVQTATSKARSVEDVARTMEGGGLPLALLRIAIIANGGSLACGVTDGVEGATHRLALDGDEVTLSAC